VCILAVRRTANDSTVDVEELLMLSAERNDFCRTDKRKVAGVKEEYHVLPNIVAGVYLLELLTHEGRAAEVRSTFRDTGKETR